MPKPYGYARVSSRDQNEARQIAALLEYGIEEKNIVVEKMSGKDFNRPLYKDLVKRMKPGDVLVVQSLDRLGRNYDEIIQQWGYLTKEQHLDIVILDMPLLDTRKDRDLIGTLVTDIVLEIFSYVAHNEREAIRKRQAEGIAEAKKRGTKFGRKKIAMPRGFVKVAKQWKSKEITAVDAANTLGLSCRTFMRRVEEYYNQ